nr:probable methyltransferase PMT17 [Tanacetum cinerariifolium]
MPDVSNRDEVSGGALEKWPERATSLPPRIRSNLITGITEKQFHEDNKLWIERMKDYKRIVTALTKGRYRNVMDMNAYLGGFSAALMKYPVWVMNVVPANIQPDTLGVIYERGFLGVYHDWCEAFSTYPRTYDFIHAGGVFSVYKDRIVPSCCVIFDLEPLSLSFDLIFISEIFKSFPCLTLLSLPSYDLVP